MNSVTDVLRQGRNGSNSQSRPEQPKSSNSAGGGLSSISSDMANGIINNLGALVELEVSKKVVDGTLMRNVEERLKERFNGFNKGLAEQNKLIEKQLQEIEVVPLALPSPSALTPPKTESGQ